MQAEFGEDALKQLRMRKAAERRAAAESQMDSNLIPLGQRVVRAMSSRAGLKLFACADALRAGAKAFEASMQTRI